jgi:hypothetical protein
MSETKKWSPKDDEVDDEEEEDTQVPPITFVPSPQALRNIVTDL